MKLIRFSVMFAIVAFSALLLGSCTKDQVTDNRDLDYGYVQFKLYKEASAQTNTESRAAKPELDYLSEAKKVKITFLSGTETFDQTLVLSAADNSAAEFGLRSEKIKLLTGSYKIVVYTLYDALDNPLYYGGAIETPLLVVAGGLEVYDLTAKVSPRGSVKFSFLKDMSGFDNTPKNTRAANRQYTFDEIDRMDVTVRHTETNTETTFVGLKTKFKIHFGEDNEENGTDGYRTASLTCDSLLSLPAGEYTVRSYNTYDKNKFLLETNRKPAPMSFIVVDNVTVEPKVGVALYESDEYIKDYYALYEIWKALDGPNWYYKGQGFPVGCNWDFNKDPDLWGYQPGVEVHSNGRIAKIVVSDFGFGGDLPDHIGQLTELIELYLGTHNDFNMLTEDPLSPITKSLEDRSRNRMANYRKYLDMLTPRTQVSEPIARALKERGISIPEMALYEKYTEAEIIDRQSGRQLIIKPYDMHPGKLSNRLRSISPEIGKLTKLEYFYVANGTLKTLPDEVKNLISCTDFEIYNCPEMKEFPLAIAEMPALISVNIANNTQWSSDEIYKGFDALANGAAQEKIQIIYGGFNNLVEVPESFRNLLKMGLLDLSFNKISKIHPFGKGISPVQLQLSHNELTELPADADGMFCNTDDIETFSVTYNKLKKFPNVFTAKTVFKMKSVDFSNNEIAGFEGEEDGTFKGVNVETLGLAGNKELTKFPKCLATSGSSVSYIILRGCSVNEIPKGSLTGRKSNQMVSFDLTYNQLSTLPDEWSAMTLPYLYGVDLSYNRFDKFPWNPLNSSELTVFALRGQRDAAGNRCLSEWPTGLFNHKGLRGFYMGSNNLGRIEDKTISYLIYFLDISDNPNIVFDAKDVCSYWRNGMYNLIYDKTQDIRNCDYMLK